MKSVVFIDTSVLCNIVPVPGWDQDTDEVLGELQVRLREGQELVLPATAVIETGNFIAQIPDGGLRRGTAERFSEILRLICAGEAPWILHDFAWNRVFLAELISGTDSGSTYIEHATNQVGAGDLCILTEVHQFRTRSRVPAKIWTLDLALSAYG